MSWYSWRPYVPVAQRRQRAAQKIAKLRKAGRELEPIAIEGRKIARTFWGSAWCDNLEAYSDYANRLPRGRTYVRNGSVVDLQIAGGQISALVSGSDFYEVELGIAPLSARKWKRVRVQCAGQIDSLVELLQGHISHAVMDIVTRAEEGLFPAPREISLSCSCPDWATMCKHVAAVLYGVGARLDHAPEMLFALRGVEPAEMVTDAVGQAPTRRKTGRGRVLAADDLSSVFGVDIEMGDADAGAEKRRRPVRRRRGTAAKKGSAKKISRRKVSRQKGSRKKPAARTRPAKSAAKKKATKKKAVASKTTQKKVTKKAGRTRAAVRRQDTASKTTTTAPKKRASRKATGTGRTIP
jgi:uncharacterized Zn finger protein